MDLRDYLEKFCVSKLAERRSPKTIRIYRDQVGRFLAWCAREGISGADLVGQTGAEVIEEYLLSMESEGFAPASIGMHYRSLRAIYHWTFDRYEEELDGKTPFKWLKRPVIPELLPKAISLNEVLILLHSIKGPARKGDPIWVPPRDRLIIKILFYSGLRSSELLSLRVCDVALENRLLKVTRWKVHTTGFLPIAKSMVPDFREWLEVYRPRAEGDGLWPTMKTGDNRGKFLASQGLEEMTRRRCLKAGLPPYRPHSFRHGAAVHLIKRGADISLVAKILGHRDISTTQHYLRFDTASLTALYDRVVD